MADKMNDQGGARAQADPPASTVGIASRLSPDARTGFICAIFAYTIWGAFPIYFKSLEGVSPLEFVSQRMIWSVPFAAIILTMRGQWPETIRAATNSKTLPMLACTAAVISTNWFFYVWAVVNDRVLEASLGYYVNPLMFVAAGVLVLGEKLSRGQWVGVGLAAAGVAVLVIGAGVVPWVSFALAISFTAYGYLRKRVEVGALPGLFIETLILAPPAALILYWLAGHGGLTLGSQGLRMDLLLALAGPLTVAPLTLFALAARRLRLSTIGFLQYIGPTGQFILGIYYGEAFTLAHGICFALIWLGLAVSSFDVLKGEKAS